jgi:NADPH2:quinone reductase
VIGTTLPLDRAAEALTIIDERRVTGKVVLDTA